MNLYSLMGSSFRKGTVLSSVGSRTVCCPKSNFIENDKEGPSIKYFLVIIFPTVLL